MKMRFNTGGVVLILIGLLLLLQNLGILQWGSLWKFWPVILIAVGISMIMPRRT